MTKNLNFATKSKILGTFSLLTRVCNFFWQRVPGINAKRHSKLLLIYIPYFLKSHYAGKIFNTPRSTKHAIFLILYFIICDPNRNLKKWIRVLFVARLFLASVQFQLKLDVCVIWLFWLTIWPDWLSDHDKN